MSCCFHPQENKQQQCEGVLDPQQEKSCSDDLRRGQLTADVVSERPTDRQTEREGEWIGLIPHLHDGLAVFSQTGQMVHLLQAL